MGGGYKVEMTKEITILDALHAAVLIIALIFCVKILDAIDPLDDGDTYEEKIRTNTLTA